MIKYILIISFFFLNNCSFDTRSGIWTDDKEIEKTKNLKKVFKEKDIVNKEFNSNLLLKSNNLVFKQNDLTNNIGITKYNNTINKSSKFRFSKIEKFDHYEPEIIFDGKNFIFFDDKSNIIKFDRNFDIVWKKNFYSKQEKKLKPILTLSNTKNYLIVFDNIGKFYAIDINSGELIWKNSSQNPFNSQVKIYNDNIYVVDLNNVLRCFSLKNGLELWKFSSENTFLKSSKRNSLIVTKGVVYFNNSLGDIIAVDANTGSLIWQIPTQSSAIYENAFRLITSDLVADQNELIFSNNKNEFYSVDLINGLINWKQEINSSVRPIFYNNLIFTISDEGYFFVIDRNLGNIIRVTDILSSFKNRGSGKIKPVGFITGPKKILLTLDNGRILVINIETGKTDYISKIDSDKISRPFVFNNEIILLKNNSIIRLN